MDHSLEMRQAIVTKLRATPSIVALIADRFYGEKVPAGRVFPFGRYGLPVTEGSEWSGGDHGRVGSRHEITLHAFAMGPDMDECSKIAKAIVATLNGAELPLLGIGLIGIDWDRTDIIRDTEEAEAYHAVIRFEAETFEAA